MYRIVTSIILIISFGLILSCSGTKKMTQGTDSEEVEVQKYPAWYPDQKVVSNDNMMLGYATAVGKNSESAVSKAVSWAETELKSTVSDKLEDIRLKAKEEFGSETGLDRPEFLIALRKATNNISSLMETGKTNVKTVEGYDSYRSFAEVSVLKEKLVEQLGENLSDYKKAWNTMKKSKAFENL